jgi:hypothetical protein
MTGMDKAGDVRRGGGRGQGVAPTAGETGVSEPAVRKHLGVGGPSPEVPKRGPSESELLAPHARGMDAWLGSDMRNWRKRRRTAAEAHGRPRGSAATRAPVPPCSAMRRRGARGWPRGAAGATRRAIWGSAGLPADARSASARRTSGSAASPRGGSAWPSPSPAPTPAPRRCSGERPPSASARGSGTCSSSWGGVPPRAVLDDAAEVGGRFGPEAGPSGLFRRFAAHHGLGHALASPYSGNGKGSVEDRVGAHRRSPFAPIPAFGDVGALNGRLLEACVALGEGRVRHGLGRAEPGPFAEDGEALSPPPAGLSCVRWETRKRSRQGALTVGGIHRHSAGPACAGRGVAVALGAFRVAICGCGAGEAVAAYEGGVGQGTDGQPGPRAPAEAALHAAERLGGLLREAAAAGRARAPPGRRAPGQAPGRPRGAAGREPREGLEGGGGGHAQAAPRDRPHRPRLRGGIGGAGPVGGCARGMRRGGRPRRLRPGAGAARGR